MSPTRKSKGCRLHSAPHKLVHFALVHTAIGAVPGEAPAYAASSDLTGCAPDDHLDQGESSTCGGHAVTIWLFVGTVANRLSFDFVGLPSPHGIIAATYRIEQPGDGPLKDTGVEPADPLLAIARTGVRAMEETRTPDGRFSDVVSAADAAKVPGAEPNLQLRPNAAQDIAAAHNLVVGAYTIEPTDPHFPALVAACLSLGKPVAACIFVDEAFEKWGADAPPATKPALDGSPNWSDPQGGGHYVVILAHRTRADGKLEFLIWNSWGNEWGCPSPARPDRGGNIWITEDFLRAAASETFAGSFSLVPRLAPPAAA